MALHVLDEANRCLGCKKPLCQQGSRQTRWTKPAGCCLKITR